MSDKIEQVRIVSYNALELKRGQKQQNEHRDSEYNILGCVIEACSVGAEPNYWFNRRFNYYTTRWMCLSRLLLSVEEVRELQSSTRAS